MNEDKECHIEYLDVQGWWDLCSAILWIILACVSLRKTRKNLASLNDEMIEGIEEAAMQSLKRRLLVNRVQFIFLCAFMIAIIW